MDIQKIQVFGSKIQIDYVDGSREEISGGKYTLKDSNGDRIERHNTTPADVARLQGIVDAFLLVVTPGADDAISRFHNDATELSVHYFDGRAESIELGVYEIKNALNQTVFQTTATPAYTDHLLALIDDYLFGDQPGMTLTGTELAERIRGGNGGDDISGLGGADDLRGERGDDSMAGGADADKMRGDSGNDSLSGGDGDDDLRGDGSLAIGETGGNDTLDGGAGNDRLKGESGNDSVLGGDGDDDQVRGGSGDDVVYGGNGIDRARGDEGNDSVFGDAGDDRVDGGDGNDTLSGGEDNDRVKGNSGDDIVSGDNGDDRVDGDEGNDMLAGGAGDDDLHGGLGDDTLDGGTGADTYHGDLGADVFVFGVDGADEKVDDFEAGVDKIDLTAFALADFDALLAVASEHTDLNGTDVTLDLGGGDTITISDLTLAQLTAGDVLL